LLDFLIKIGGSLIKYPSDLKKLCKLLPSFFRKRKFCILPGGGLFADCVRKVYKVFRLSDDITHWMAIMGMDQYGMMLGELIEGSVVIDDINNVKKVILENRIPIILPYKHLRAKDPLPHSWDVTSDSIAIYIAGEIGINNIILLKDVDGIYTTDPKKFRNTTLLYRVCSRDLLKLRNSCIDKYSAILIKQYNVKCYIINGRKPERLCSILSDKNTICTVIIP